MQETYFHRVQQQTPTRFWINNVTREEAVLAITAGAVGCTQNPAYIGKMMSNCQEAAYVDAKLDDVLAEEPDDNEALVKLQRELVTAIAEHFRPIHAASGGRSGYVSIQGDPFHEDMQTIVRCALFNIAPAPNLMAKVPVTEEGLKAIRVLLARGVPVNATEVMSVRQALDVCELYNEVCTDMEKPPRVYFSHITGIFDEYLRNQVVGQKIAISPDTLWHAGMTVAKKIYALTRLLSPAVGFISGGARGLHHFTEMVGADAAVTINWKGTADQLVEQDPVVCQRFLMPTPHAVLDELCEKLPDFRRAYFKNGLVPDEYEDYGPVVLFRSGFEQSWTKTLDYIRQRRG